MKKLLNQWSKKKIKSNINYSSNYYLIIQPEIVSKLDYSKLGLKTIKSKNKNKKISIQI